MRAVATCTIALLLFASSCGDDEESSTPKQTSVGPRALPPTSHARTKLRWKRFRAIQNDLARALELPERELCTERNGAQCAAAGRVRLTDWLRNENIPEEELEDECKRRQESDVCVDGDYIPFDNPRGAHVIALGGNNTFLGGVYDPLPEPIVTTPLALERTVLTACGERVARDVDGPAVVFTLVDLGQEAFGATSEGAAATIDDLYRRLLSRTATTEERAAVLTMLDEGPMTAPDFARLACFAVGTQQEFIFQ